MNAHAGEGADLDDDQRATLFAECVALTRKRGTVGGEAGGDSGGRGAGGEAGGVEDGAGAEVVSADAFVKARST